MATVEELEIQLVSDREAVEAARVSLDEAIKTKVATEIALGEARTAEAQPEE